MREPKKFSAPHITRPPAKPEVLKLNIPLLQHGYALSVAVLRFLPYQTTITP